MADFSIKNANEEKKKRLHWDDGDSEENKWADFIELWCSNCNGYAFLLLQIHEDCIPTGMQIVHSNKWALYFSFTYLQMKLWNVSNVICNRKICFACVNSNDTKRAKSCQSFRFIETFVVKMLNSLFQSDTTSVSTQFNWYSCHVSMWV